MIYKTRKRYRGEPICTDPTADPRENETALHFTSGDRRLWISSYEPTVIAGLLAHPDFQIEHLIFMQANGRESVVGVIGKLPVGALSIGRTRQSDSHELIIKTHLRAADSQLSGSQQFKLKLARRTRPREIKRFPRDRKSRASTKKGRVRSKRQASARRPRKRGQRKR